MRFVFLAGLLALAGCTDYTDPTIVTQNKTTLSGTGFPVGTLPDGRKVIRYEIEMGSNRHNHWIYIVDDGKTPSISVNNTVQNGKATGLQTYIVIDGVKYQRVEEE